MQCPKFWSLRLYSVLSLTPKLEHHSRKNGWCVSGVGLTGVWVKFSTGIHYLHSAFLHWSDARKCKNVITGVLFLRAWKRYEFGNVGIAQKYFGTWKKKWFSKYQLIDKKRNEKTISQNFTTWQSDQRFTNISIWNRRDRGADDSIGSLVRSSRWATVLP